MHPWFAGWIFWRLCADAPQCQGTFRMLCHFHQPLAVVLHAPFKVPALPLHAPNSHHVTGRA